jgi:predicted O-methyltransferase YrrM
MAVEGFTEPEELEWLLERARACRTVIEVGTWKGRSAVALALGCPGHVYTVDHFKGSPSELDAAHAEARGGDIAAAALATLSAHANVTVLNMPSLQASRLTGPVDMVFIDGDHDRLPFLVDLLAWAPKARRLLCGHDIGWDGVVEGLALYGVPFQLGPGSLWYMELI